jgi:carbonic anhydrase
MGWTVAHARYFKVRRGTVTVTDELLHNNDQYAEGFDKGDLPLPPAKQVAVVACMDARIHVSKILGLEEGDAHIIRNAGGVVTDDEIRSLAISQRLLGTSEIILIHHTDCGMLTFRDDDFRSELQRDRSGRPRLFGPRRGRAPEHRTHQAESLHQDQGQRSRVRLRVPKWLSQAFLKPGRRSRHSCDLGSRRQVRWMPPS